MSGGWRINDRFSFGLGFHIINFDMLYNESIVSLKGQYPSRENFPMEAQFETTNFHVNTGAYTISSGIYYRFKNFLDMGFKVKSRSVQQWENGNIMAYNLSYQKQNFKAIGIIPEDVRVHFRLGTIHLIVSE